MIVNELLTYVKFYINSSAIENIKKVVQHFYTEDEVVQAKRTLWSECSNKGLGKYPERKSTDVRPAKIPHIDDIIEALKMLDAADKLPDIVARNIDRLPDRQPEEMNLLMVVQRITDLEKTVKLHNDTLSNLKIEVLDIKDSSINKTLYSSVVNRNASNNNNEQLHKEKDSINFKK